MAKYRTQNELLSRHSRTQGVPAFGRDEITTSRGVTVRILGVSPLLMQDIWVEHPDPAPPTYTVTPVTGEAETHPLDASLLDTEERRAAWTAYQAGKQAAESERNSLILEVFLLEGIQVDLPVDDALESWKRRQQRYGLTIPEDPDDLLLTWIRRAVIGGIDDMIAIQEAVAAKSGIDQRAIQRVEAMFRGDVERDAAGGPDAAAEQVAHVADGAGDAGGQGVGRVATE